MRARDNPEPGPIRQAFGWLLIVVSPVPGIFSFVGLFQTWDRLGQANSPIWTLPIVMLCYLTFTAALLCVGRGLLSGRDKLVWNGSNLFWGTMTVFLTLFFVFD